MTTINETKLNEVKEIAESFSELCGLTYEYWQMYQTMYETTSKHKIDDKDISGTWGKLGIAFLHHTILQIAKINDPAKHRKDGKDCNFSLAYFIDCVVKKDSYRDSYNKFRTDNKVFIAAIKKARVKVVAHRDLETYYSPDPVGDFPAGLDEKYFNSLREIISEGYKELSLDFPAGWPSSSFIVDRTKIFMNTIITAFNPQ